MDLVTQSMLSRCRDLLPVERFWFLLPSLSDIGASLPFSLCCMLLMVQQLILRLQISKSLEQPSLIAHPAAVRLYLWGGAMH